MLPSFRIAADQHDNVGNPKTAMIVSRSPHENPGRPRTYTGKHGTIRRLYD
ncbi:hypothetical protein DPMN_187672 [Dreissena polymorpha]|uniref:Uncharacterized protein n=1 Tax=Dreissena polymorpha TaxID=45954 RepID=A0A9D4IAN3_DREPO|nr:hypothetical protein DPMN_187672 [Dreissena polymorpha]